MKEKQRKMVFLISVFLFLGVWAAFADCSWQARSYGHVKIYFPAEYRQQANLFLQQSQIWLAEMDSWLAGSAQIDTATQVRVVLSPADSPLVRLGGDKRRTAGFYWLGTVFILDVTGPHPPLSHELGHWVIDRAAAGNAPRWFSEGFAQHAEWQLTGYILPLPEENSWSDAAATEQGNAIYTLSQLQYLFEDQEQQLSAYHFAFCAFTQLLADFSWADLQDILSLLSAGLDWPEAFEQIAAQPFDHWEAEFFQEYDTQRLPFSAVIP